MKIGIVSGGFDPLHTGHLDMIDEARGKSDFLIAIVNNDEFLIRKKGFFFMELFDRARIVNSLLNVDHVVLSKDKDDTVCHSLEKINRLIDDILEHAERYPDPDDDEICLTFMNGGDRKEDNIPEYDLCKELGIEMMFNIGGGKTQSSSDLVKKVRFKQWPV